MERLINPWEPNDEAQKAWFAKWNKEDQICSDCQKQKKCTTVDRMNTGICALLATRIQ